MKQIFKILIILFLTSCTAHNFQTVSGHYRTKGGFEWGSSIILKPDSNFVYDWQTGLIYGHETGKWNLEGNKIILDSDFRPKQDTTSNFHLIDKKMTESSNIEFQLYFPDSTQALIGADGLMFYGTDTIFNSFSNVNGIMTFPKQEHDSIKITFIGFKDIVIPKSKCDYFKIATVDVLLDNMYEYFDNEVWKIRGKHLIDTSKNEHYYERKFYKIQ